MTICLQPQCNMYMYTMNFKGTLIVKKKIKGGEELEKVKLWKVDISVNEMCSV